MKKTLLEYFASLVSPAAYYSSALLLWPACSIAAGDAPLSETGEWLEQHGVGVHLQASQFYFTNPSAGLQTHESEALTMLLAGADIDLERMNLIPGGKVHFLQLWVPFSHNWDYGTQVGDTLVGNPPPYIPQTAHLMRFTYEQTWGADDRYSLEFGKSNPGMYFGTPQCDSPMACVNTLLVNSVGYSAMPYSGWGARMAWRATPQLTAGVGGWRTYRGYPFTNGWEEGFRGDGKGENALLAANLVSRQDWRDARYPLNWELMATHSFRSYNEPYYTVNGTSQVTDSSAAARRDSGASALYVGAKKALWRQDGGRDADNRHPTAISGYADMTYLLNEQVDNGLGSLLHTGLILSSPWESRPLDSYSLNVSWLRLTSDEQRFLTDAFRSAGGRGWSPDRNQYQASLTANLFLTPDVELQLIGSRTWKMNNWGNPYTSLIPQNGWSFVIQANLYLDTLLGLTPRR
ncbi:carbohydrate porin [Musicola keenii]|uniref:carbohydrate porin n=1 Tax=Musicola keenii TaxID=2884250 RepID=UPI00177C4E69|nr:carbohydrate porin [Musicola keenii]